MAKYKAVRKKTDAPPQVRPGVPCLVILIGGLILTCVLMYLVMKSA
jgi:hypothetical protein